MKRRLFFWLEKLKISRNERYAVFLLMIILTMLVSINAIFTGSSPLHQKKYAMIEKRFKARTAQINQEHKELMARYHPKEKAAGRQELAAPDTVRKDTLRSEKPKAKKTSPAQSLINVNTAAEKTLQKLKGIGPTYAHRIVVYRQQNGPFKSKGELIKIKGIGKKRLANIKGFIKLTDQP